MAAFATFGLFWGSWAVMLFNIQHAFALNDAQLGVLLAVAIAVAGVSSAVMAHYCDRVGRAASCGSRSFAWSVLLCVLALIHEKWAFAVVLVLIEVAGGSIDTAMNAEASHRLVDQPPSRSCACTPSSTPGRWPARPSPPFSSTPACTGAGCGRGSPSSPWASGCGPS